MKIEWIPVLSFLLLYACGKDDQNLLASLSKSSVIFTILEEDMVLNKDYTTGFAAGAVKYPDRLEFRTVGIAKLDYNDEGLYRVVDLDLQTLNGTIDCKAGICTFRLKVWNNSCPVSMLPLQAEMIIPCNEVGFIHLTLRDSLKQWSDTFHAPVRKPHTDFQFFALGHLTDKSKQLLPIVSSDKPLVFAIDEHMKDDPEFIDDLSFAMAYWNSMIGFDALNFDVEIEAKRSFDPLASVIVYDDCGEFCGGDARAGYFADPASGAIISGKVDLFPNFFALERNGRRNTLTHELGHVLGLAHNYAASQDFENFLTTNSTSVMDIGDPDLSDPLPYDRAVIDWMYRGIEPQTRFASCSDPQVLYVKGCDDAYSEKSSRISEAEYARSLQQVLSIIPDSLANQIADSDEGNFEQDVIQLQRDLESEDLIWGFRFLALADVYLGRQFINAHKLVAFSTKPDEETQSAWVDLLTYTITDSAVTYTPSQLSFLKITKKVMLERPMNLENLEQFISAGPVERQ